MARPMNQVEKYSIACQICQISSSGAPVYLGRITDLCHPVDEQYTTCQKPADGSCISNYCDSFDGLFETNDSRAALFGATFMMTYGTLKKPTQPSGESYKRIRWSLEVNKNTPMRSSIPDLKVASSDESPCPLVFPICTRCTRLSRNYLHHLFLNKPPVKKGDLYGYDLLYNAMLKRFLSRNVGMKQPRSLYMSAPNIPDRDGVEMLGRAVLVRTVEKGDKESEIALPPEVDIFQAIPSMPKWIMSKLQKVRPAAAPIVDSEESPAREYHVHDNQLLKLPNELLEQITFDLDRPSVLTLRLVHPLFAARLPLDQTFWCNELLFGEPPLFGFEPLIDNHVARHPGEFLGRIDALSEVGNHFTKPRKRSKFSEGQEPSLKLRAGDKVNKTDWREYDWMELAKKLSSSAEFEDGGSYADAPRNFLYRRRLWGAIDRLINAGE